MFPLTPTPTCSTAVSTPIAGMTSLAGRAEGCAGVVFDAYCAYVMRWLAGSVSGYTSALTAVMPNTLTENMIAMITVPMRKSAFTILLGCHVLEKRMRRAHPLGGYPLFFSLGKPLSQVRRTGDRKERCRCQYQHRRGGIASCPCIRHARRSGIGRCGARCRTGRCSCACGAERSSSRLGECRARDQKRCSKNGCPRKLL